MQSDTCISIDITVHMRSTIQKGTLKLTSRKQTENAMAKKEKQKDQQTYNSTQNITKTTKY